jgi:predicted permease
MLRPLRAVQVGFSFLVLFGAGLLVISFHRLSSVDLGFAAEKLLIVRVETEVPEDEGRAARWQQVVDTLRQLPGIEAVSHSAWELFGGSGWSSAVRIPGRAIEASEPYFLQVSPGFLATMRIRLLEGRDFDDHDREPVKNRVVLVNEAFARRYFPDGSALGRSFFRLESATEEVSQEIVGVVRNARYRSLREPAPPTVYLPHRPEARATLQVRARADLAALALDLPQRVRKADPGFRVNEVVPQATLVSDTALRERLLALLSAFFAAVALLLVAVGLYGVMSYSVVRRTREIGIRMALGAQRAAVVRLVVGEVALVVAMGLAVGLGAGLAGARLLASLLFEVRPADLVSLGLPLAGLLLASILSILPAARRAVRVDPITALRCD